MSQLQVANITFSAAGSTRIETDATANVVRVIVNSANTIYSTPVRTVFPTGTVNVDNELAVTGRVRAGSEANVAGNMAIAGSLFIAGANVVALIEAAGGAPAATQAEQEAATEAAAYVAPATQHFHPSAAKFWVKATGNSTTIETSYNMTSWTDTNVGIAAGVIATDFSSEDWAGMVQVQLSAALLMDATYTSSCAFVINSLAVGGFTVTSGRMQDGGTAAASLQDPQSWHVVGFGDH